MGLVHNAVNFSLFVNNFSPDLRLGNSLSHSVCISICIMDDLCQSHRHENPYQMTLISKITILTISFTEALSRSPPHASVDGHHHHHSSYAAGSASQDNSQY